ncbi:carbohydrate binding domain-containing protein, partial [Paenibacillus sp. P22]|uniref:carbohydrate binding domain-containing protein n=1 Tax=Paenibacillus sp. P22 TaxID=483908 RepID=UPI0004348B52
LVHRIEGVKTFAGSKATVSFYAKANTNKQIIVKGTQDFGSGGSPSTRNTFETTSPITLSSNWKKYSYTFTIPAISGKFLGSNSDDYLEVAFWFPNNDTYVIDLAEMVFNIGDAALPLQPREEALELLLCQRTFEKSYDVETPPGSTGTMQGIYNHVGSPSTATGIGILVNFKVPKRSVPIISLYDMIGNVGKLSSWNGGSQSNNLSAAIDQISMNKFRVLATVSSGNYELYGHYTASCDL